MALIDVDRDEHGVDPDALARDLDGIETSPASAEAFQRQNRAQLFRGWRRSRRALERLDSLVRCLTADPANPSLLAMAADFSLRCGRVRRAAEFYAALMATGQATSEQMRRYGFALFTGRRFHAATTLFRKSIQRQLTDALARRHLGCVLFAMGRMEEAVSSYRSAIALSPSDPEPYRNLARTEAFCGKDNVAIGLYERALVLDPDFAEAHRNLGNLYYHQHNFSAAEVSYRRALALGASHALTFYNIGCVLLAQGHPDSAAFLRKAIDADPSGYPIFYRALRDAAPADDGVRARVKAMALHAFRRNLSGTAYDADKVLYLQPASFPDFFAANHEVEKAAVPKPAHPRLPDGDVHAHTRHSVGNDQAFRQRGLHFVRHARIDVSYAPYCSSASIFSGDRFAADKVYERPAHGVTSSPFYFPPNAPTALPEWLRNIDLPVRSFDEPGLFIGGSHNYGHFLLDTLGKLLAAECFGGFNGLPVYTFPLHRIFGEIAGRLFPEHRFVDVSTGLANTEEGAILRFSNVHVPANAPYDFICDRLRRRAEAAGLYASQACGAERVYLSRRTHALHRRRVVNDEEIADFLERHGFVTVFPEQLDFEETVALFRAARVIVSPIGAQYGNVIFAEPGAVYVELTPNFHRSNPSNQTYDCISHYSGVQFRRVWGEAAYIDRKDSTLWLSRFDPHRVGLALSEAGFRL